MRSNNYITAVLLGTFVLVFSNAVVANTLTTRGAVEKLQLAGDDLGKPQVQVQLAGDDLGKPQVQVQLAGDDLGKPQVQVQLVGDDLGKPQVQLSAPAIV